MMKAVIDQVAQERDGVLLAEARKLLEADKGAAALEPYNQGFLMSGDVTKKLDPYFPFEKSVEQWGRSFSALGIEYEGASMNLQFRSS